MLRDEVFQQSAERSLVRVRRLHSVLEIGKAGFASPCVSVIKICAVIQGSAFKYRFIVFLADDNRLHRLDAVDIRMVMRSGQCQAVNVLRVLRYLCFGHRKLRQVRMIEYRTIHKYTKQAHRRPSL